MTRGLKIYAIAILAAASALGLARDQDFSFDLQPLFPRMPLYGMDAVPVVATIENKGPDARGVITAGETVHISYPIELPRGTKKRLIIYVDPMASYGASNGVVLDTDQCHIESRVPITPFERVQTSVLLVSDSPGQLAFLRRDADDHTPGVQDDNMKPGSGPDRASAFAGFTTMVLGDGSERLTDGEVQAIKGWVLTGGTLIFIGGASSPVLADPRWQGVRPADRFETKTLNQGPATASGERLAGPITVQSPLAFSGIQHGAFKVVRGYGLGQAICLALNPFEQPVSLWPGRTEYMRDVCSTSRSSLEKVLMPFLGQGNDDGYSRSTYTGTYYRHDETTSPFQTSLPPTPSVAWVLLGYVVAVGPLNFLILKRMKKGEWAWLTAPVLSIGAAAILFANAGNLYSAKTATSSQGILVMNEGSQDACFIGSTQMFFPHGGYVDLKLRGVESIGNRNENDYGPQTESSDIDAVDVGEVQVPALHTTNLAFREMSYRQHLALPSPIRVTLIRQGRTIRCQVTNTSQFTLYNLHLDFAGRASTDDNIAPLQPGSSVALLVNLDTEGPQQPETLLSGEREAAYVSAAIQGFRPGPEVGADYSNSLAFIENLNVPKGLIK